MKQKGRLDKYLFNLRDYLILLIVIKFVLILSSFIPSPSYAYYLQNVAPAHNSWVTSSPYTFQWNNNAGSGVWWGGESNSYWYYSLLTIYNNTWGFVNNDSWLYQPGFGYKSYSRTLTESPINSSYWRVRGYYQYTSGYWSYQIIGWQPVWRIVMVCYPVCYWYWWSGWRLRCYWVCYFYCYLDYVPIYGWVWVTTYNWAYTSSTSNWYFGVDLYPPTVTLSSPSNGYSACNNATINFLFSATDSASGINTNSSVSYLEIRKDSTSGSLITRQAIVSGNNTISYTFTQPGTYYWMVRAQDNVGRVTTSEWRSIIIDTLAPNVSSLISPINNVWLTSSTVTFRWNSTTDSGTGVKGYYIKIKRPDGTDYPGYEGTYGRWVGNVTTHTVTGMIETSSGSYSWTVYAEDNCNNRTTAFTGDGRFRIDYSNPNINIVKPDAPPYWYNEYTATSVNFNANFSDDVSGIFETQLKVYRPGNILDQAYPLNTYPEYTRNASINVNRSCAGFNGVWRAEYYVKDHAGLTNIQSRNFQVDVTRPTVGQITSIDGISIVGNPITNTYPIVKTATPVITWTAASDPAPQSGVANYFIKIWNESGQLVANATLPSTQLSYTPPALTTGKYYFEVSVTDVAKNGAIKNVDGIADNNQTLYTYPTNTSFPNYTNFRSFIVDLDAPQVTGYTPPLPKSGNGSYDWVVSTNPTYSGEMRDTYGISRYQIRLYRKTGTTYTQIETFNSGSPITTNDSLYIIPNVNITTLTDGLYGFEIEAWDSATNVSQRTSTIAPPTYATQKYDFKVDVTPPIAGSAIQPINNDWIVAPNHSNPRRPTFKFTAANDNQVGNHDDASFSDVKEYMIRIWWDPSFPMSYSSSEAPFFGQPYKDYYIGNNTTFTIPDDLKNGGYYWDVWVKDNANNWRWYYNSTSGNYTVTSVYGNTSLPPSSSPYRFRIDAEAPTTNVLVSEINDKWISVFNPNFTWKAGDDPMPGSGKAYYELWLWGSSGGTPIVVTRIPCNTAPGNASYDSLITLPYGGGQVVSGAWPPAPSYLPNGRHYWDVRLVDNAGNYKWYKSGLVNQPTTFDKGETFRVDKIPPQVGGIVYPKNNEWIDQRGTRFVDINTGDFIYKPNRKPVFRFKAARDNESGLFKYIVVLKDARNPKVLIGDYELTPSSAPELFALNYGVEYTFTPPWGSGTWPVELKDGKYFWEVMVIDNTRVNTSYYNNSNGNDNNFATFRLDTVPPTVAPNKIDPIRTITISTIIDVAPNIGVGELLEPKYGYVTTTSVNLVNFKFSKAVDDIGLSFNGYKLNNPAGSLYPTEGPSGIYRYCFVIATARDKLKEISNVDIWSSGYTIDTQATVISIYPQIPPDIDDMLNQIPLGSLYWSVHVMDNAGNESQYVDRKLRIRHLPPGGGNLEAPPNGFITTNRRPKFKWTK